MEHAEMIAAVLGVISAILGIVTAIINRRRIVELRHSTTSSYSAAPRPPVTLAKRFKRFAIMLVLMLFCFCGIGAVVGPGPPYSEAGNIMGVILLVPLLIFCLMAAYQVIAMIIVIFARLWE